MVHGDRQNASARESFAFRQESKRMSVKAGLWAGVGAIAVGAVLLFNYWASFQPLSTLVYCGLVLALAGLANVAVPFRFLGVRRRGMGALVFAGGVALAFTGLYWPAAMIHVAHHKTLFDDVVPQYQFGEKHSVRVHARPEQAIAAARAATWGDLRSLVTLMKIRGAVSGHPYRDNGAFSVDKRILDAFAASGYVTGGDDDEVVMAGGADTQAGRALAVRSLQAYASFRKPGAVKMAFAFYAEDAGGGWSTLTTETRMVVEDGSSRGPAIYWRLIVPGSGLLRREWLEGIKRRAEAWR
jgi:hypothetical protein